MDIGVLGGRLKYRRPLVEGMDDRRGVSPWTQRKEETDSPREDGPIKASRVFGPSGLHGSVSMEVPVGSWSLSDRPFFTK